MKELNKHILDEALGKLPGYEPGDTIWDHMERGLSADEVTGRLKSFDPPEEVWSNISRELEKTEKLTQLQDFTPGEEIWNTISGKLNSGGKSAMVRKMITWSGWIAAAVIALLLGYFMVIRPTADHDIHYSTITISQPNTGNWQQSNEEIYDALNRVCAANPVACSGEAFQKQKQELEFLDRQQELIRQRMSPYRDNKELQLMLTKIELEKSDIVKQMISSVL